MASGDEKAEDNMPEESNVDHINGVIKNSEETTSDQKPIEAEDIHRIDENKSETDEETSVEKEPVKIKHNHAVKHHDTAIKAEHKDDKRPVHKKVINHDNHTVKKDVHTKAKEHEHTKVHEKPKAETQAHKKPVHKPVYHATIISRPEMGIKSNEHKKAKPEIRKTVNNQKRVNMIKKPTRGDKMANHKERKKGFKLSKNTLLWVGIGVLAAVLVTFSATWLLLRPAKTIEKP